MRKRFPEGCALEAPPQWHKAHPLHKLQRMDELGRSLSPRRQHCFPTMVALQLATLAVLVAYLDDSEVVRRWAGLLALLVLVLVVVDAVVWAIRSRPR